MTILLGIGVFVLTFSVVFVYTRIKTEQRRAFNRTINNSFPVGIKPTYYSKD